MHNDLIKSGKIKGRSVAERRSRGEPITTRASVARCLAHGHEPGGQFTIPRELIQSVVNNFHNIRRTTRIYESTFCCGGGGGLLTDDLMESAGQGRSAPGQRR